MRKQMNDSVLFAINLVVLVYQSLFIFAFGANYLPKINESLADGLWLAAGCLGPACGLLDVVLWRRVKHRTIEASIITVFIGCGLLVLDYVGYLIAAM
ncbi:MAG: hypothetical protein ABF586_00400 [Sporolactobacillus sp.]